MTRIDAIAAAIARRTKRSLRLQRWRAWRYLCL